MLDGQSFAAAGEAGDVNEFHSAGNLGVHQTIKSDDLVSWGMAWRVLEVGVDGRENAVEAIFHVADEVLGAGQIRGVGVDLGDGKKVLSKAEAKNAISQVAGLVW